MSLVTKFRKNSNSALCKLIELIRQKDLVPLSLKQMLGEQADKWRKSGILTEDEEFDVVALLSTW